MTVEDGEHQALADRLRAGPIARRERVRLTLHGRDQNVVAPATTPASIESDAAGLDHRNGEQSSAEASPSGSTTCSIAR